MCELTRAFRSFLSNTRWPSIVEFRFFPSTCTFTGSPISQLLVGRCMINICCNKIKISACFSSILWSGFIYLKCRLKLQEFGLCQWALTIWLGRLSHVSPPFLAVCGLLQSPLTNFFAAEDHWLLQLQSYHQLWTSEVEWISFVDMHQSLLQTQRRALTAYSQIRVKMQIPTIHCVHLICGSRRKCMHQQQQ